MKPGDLVCLKAMTPSSSADVVVSWTRPLGTEDEIFPLDENNSEKTYPVGTVVVFLQKSEKQMKKKDFDWSFSWILVEGQVGWVWDEELAELPQGETK